MLWILSYDPVERAPPMRPTWDTWDSTDTVGIVDGTANGTATGRWGSRLRVTHRRSTMLLLRRYTMSQEGEAGLPRGSAMNLRLSPAAREALDEVARVRGLRFVSVTIEVLAREELARIRASRS